MPRRTYPVLHIKPFQENSKTGFELEFTLDNGRPAKAILHPDKPSWTRIRHIDQEQAASICISAHNHELLSVRTLDFEIYTVYLPMSVEGINP